jgi:hypothetical protein
MLEPNRKCLDRSAPGPERKRVFEQFEHVPRRVGLGDRRGPMSRTCAARSRAERLQGGDVWTLVEHVPRQSRAGDKLALRMLFRVAMLSDTDLGR